MSVDLNVNARRRAFRALLAGDQCLFPASIYDPLSARAAEELGFEIVFMAGSVASYVILGAPDLVVITLSELAEQSRRISRATHLPFFLDADHGFGNAMSAMRSVQELEAAGLSGITIEDTALPESFDQKGASLPHSLDESVGKMKAALAARTDPDFIIVARTNARRLHGLDEALRRGEAFKKAGADMVFVFTRNADEMRTVAERVAPPLMTFAPADGFAEFPLKERDLAALGYRLAASSGTAFAAMVKAVRQSYQCLAQGKIDPFIGKGNVEKEMKAAAATAGLERLLEIERRTMKD